MRSLAPFLLILVAAATAFVFLRQHDVVAPRSDPAESAAPTRAALPPATLARTPGAAESAPTSTSRPATRRGPYVRGRLVLTGGTPVANASVTRQLVAEHPGMPERSLGGIWVKTDGGGHFRFEQIGSPELPWRWRYDFEHDLDVERVRRARGTHAFPVDLLRDGETDLGTIVLTPDPELVVLASGTLRGLSDAELKKVAFSLGRYPPGEGYLPIRCRVERAGTSFRLLGPATDAELELAARGEGSLRWSRFGAVAALQDLDVTLVKGRTVRGRVEIGADLVAAAREAGTNLLYLQVEDGSGRHLRSFEVLASGPLSLAPLPEAPVNVQVRAQLGGWVLAEVRDVRANDDPRLDPLRIEPACRLARLRIVTPEGKARSNTAVEFTIQPGTGRAQGRTDDAGRIVLVLPAATRRLVARVASGPELECPIAADTSDVVSK